MLGTSNRESAVKIFAQEYQSSLKSSAPVRTGRLRDSILVIPESISTIFNIETLAVSYATEVNKRNGFIDENDSDVDTFASDYAEELWDDLYDEFNETE